MLPLTLLPGCGTAQFDSHYAVGQIPGETVKKIVDSTDFRRDYAVLIDMSVPSDKKRLFLFDISGDSILFSTWVAHGKGSGRGAKARKFSNEEGSYCTSLGIYRVLEDYKGKHGLSYRLEGLQQSNSNALDRDIVMHAADYVGEEFTKREGRAGNSWGCPVVSPEALDTLKKYLRTNMLLWIYY
ncbi:MAG: murein L,D-transpeptidase catalytic domain family protein [Bacteroidetes bacterium]|nr:murein L,D-transpeptidase catalytic domain family protein [Bacteroidota bacterium]